MTVLSHQQPSGDRPEEDRLRWTPVCEASRIPPAFGVAALLPGGVQVAVFRTDTGDLRGLSNVDPFSGAAVLSRGIVGDVGGAAVVASPVYKQNFELATGVCLDDESVRVETYPVRVVDGTVEIGTGEIGAGEVGMR